MNKYVVTSSCERELNILTGKCNLALFAVVLQRPRRECVKTFAPTTADGEDTCLILRMTRISQFLRKCLCLPLDPFFGVPGSTRGRGLMSKNACQLLVRHLIGFKSVSVGVFLKETQL